MIRMLASENTASWDGASQYPFEEDAINDEETENTNIIDTIKNKIVSVEKVFENAVTKDYPLRMPFVLLNKAWNKYICGMNMTTALSGTNFDEQTVIRLENGMLAYYMYDFDYAENVQNLSDFAAEMTAQGRNFLFFEALTKSQEAFDSGYLSAYKNYTEEKRPEICRLLSESGINFASCVEQMQKEEIPAEALFFETDHHWLPQTGLRACGLLADALNNTAGYNIDCGIFDESNYEITCLPDYFLGSLGKKVTEVYTEREDFPIILPKYDSNLTVFHSYLNETLTGTIEDTMFAREYLTEDSIYERYPYSYYAYGDEALLQIRNNNLSDGRRILFIKESFADVMAPYLSNIAEYVDFIDLRMFNGSLHTYIEQTNPDTVAIIYSIRGFENAAVFDFS